VDRGEIERHDFPTGRRGYDPATVDEHLRHVADEIERLRGRPAAHPTLSGGTSEEVRLILEAAERGASAVLARAGEDASDHVERIRTAADGLLGKLDALEGELNGLLDGLRQGGERLARGMEELQAEAAAGAGRTPPAVEEEDFAAAAPAPEPAEEGDPAADRDAPPSRAGDPARDAPPPLGADPLPDTDEAGARLIALNMALDGTPREETARYLAEHYALADPDGLLDDVYSRAGR
jgi:DivIVA domain-containing protein